MHGGAVARRACASAWQRVQTYSEHGLSFRWRFLTVATPRDKKLDPRRRAQASQPSALFPGTTFSSQAFTGAILTKHSAGATNDYLA